MVDASGRKVIGQKASEFDSQFGGTWIRGFREGETQLRILEPTADWWRYKEHYGGSKSIGYVPCAGADNGCILCADPAERVRSTTTKFAFNAIDKDGRVRVFKLGTQMKKKIQMREQRIAQDILSKQDILIIRVGTGFTDTEYDLDWGEKYDVDWPDESQINDLSAVVSDAYYSFAEAFERGDLTDADDVPAEHAEGVDEPATEQAPAKKTTPAKKTAASKAAAAKPAEPDPEPEQKEKPARGRIGAKATGGDEAQADLTAAAADPEPETPDETEGAVPDGEKGDDMAASNGNGAVSDEVVADMIRRFKAMEPDELRDMLGEAEIAFPARAAKPRLVALCERGVVEGKIAPF